MVCTQLEDVTRLLSVPLNHPFFFPQAIKGLLCYNYNMLISFMDIHLFHCVHGDEHIRTHDAPIAHKQVSCNI
jgi:hypothetical protein